MDDIRSITDICEFRSWSLLACRWLQAATHYWEVELQVNKLLAQSAVTAEYCRQLLLSSGGSCLMAIWEVYPFLNEKCQGNTCSDQPEGAGGSELPSVGDLAHSSKLYSREA